jgi:hypothetical protein
VHSLALLKELLAKLVQIFANLWVAEWNSVNTYNYRHCNIHKLNITQHLEPSLHLETDFS